MFTLIGVRFLVKSSGIKIVGGGNDRMLLPRGRTHQMEKQVDERQQNKSVAASDVGSQANVAL